MANQTYQMVFSASCGGQFVQNILHFFFDDSGFTNPVSAAKALIDGFLAADLLAEWSNLHPENYVMNSIKARRATGGIGPEYIDLSVSGTNGERTGDAPAAGNGPVILWIPASPNRVTCKTFIAGVSNNDIDRGELSASAVEALKESAGNLLEAFPVVGGGNPDAVLCCVAANNKANRRLIVAVEISREVGVQRRRQLPI